MLKILIADGHGIVRRGLRDLVGAHSDWMVCGDAADGPSAIVLAATLQPTIAIVDVSLPLVNGITVTRRLQTDVPGIRVLTFTSCDDTDTVRAALAAGARGYVLKSDSISILEAAITALADNKPYFTSLVSDILLENVAPGTSSVERLSDRQLEVTELISKGNSNKQVARLLNISPKTVESHRTGAMRKANVHTTAALVMFAIRHNLVEH